MKTLYMHLGTPKTATSSIQVACAQNTELLHRNGYSFPIFSYLYPGVRIERNGHFLIEASLKREKIPDQTTTWEERLALGLDMVHDEFEKYDNVILTDESFWRSMNYNKQSPLAILKKDASEHGYHIKLIVYLRRQDSYLISRWNQFVKEGTMMTPLPEHLAWMLENEPLVTDYAAALDKLSEQVGKENVIVRRFEASSWVGGSIYTDFADAIGLPSNASLNPPARDVNLGLKGNAVEIQLMINRNSHLSSEDKAYFGGFTRRISAKMPDDDLYNVFSAAETKEFLERFEKGNEYVVKEYIKDEKPLFSEKIKNLPKWERDNQYLLKDAAAFLFRLPTEKRALLLSAFSDEERMLFVTAAIAYLEMKNMNVVNAVEKYNQSAEGINKIKNGLRHPAKSVKKLFS